MKVRQVLVEMFPQKAGIYRVQKDAIVNVENHVVELPEI